MTVKRERDGNRLTLFIEGKLDAVTSPELEKELDDLADVGELVFDLKETLYTSSAGLRVFLRAQEIMDEQGSMTVRNVNDTVMDIFRETGFLKILDVED